MSVGKAQVGLQGPHSGRVPPPAAAGPARNGQAQSWRGGCGQGHFFLSASGSCFLDPGPRLCFISHRCRTDCVDVTLCRTSPSCRREHTGPESRVACAPSQEGWEGWPWPPWQWFQGHGNTRERGAGRGARTHLFRPAVLQGQPVQPVPAELQLEAVKLALEPAVRLLQVGRYLRTGRHGRA